MSLLASIGMGDGIRVGTWIASKLPWRKLVTMPLFGKARYKARLKRKLIEMPFLFRDMQLSARDDYVSLDVLTVMDGELRAQSKAFADLRGPVAKFEAYRKAFLFANGGYGKTTLFRNLALEALSRRFWQKFLGARGLLPVYVPLKVVNTAVDFAIMDAIQATDTYFSGARGLRRLRRLGSKGKLIILFDGYDEMPYTGGFDHVKRELETLFEKSSISETMALGYASVFDRSQYAPVYQAIRESRIYLASRREFFEYNPISAPVDVQTWLVRGLDDRRITLVEKIFSKYRAKTVSSSGKILNAELFLQQLSRAESEIVEMSRSPLFLTVMCYVYVTQGASDKSSVFSSGSGDLVRTCIGLLLQDLDEYKSREFDSAARLAISNRRSAYPEEKLAFLEFFAKSLYEDGLSYFGEAYVSDLAREYFGKESRSAFCEEILRGLDTDDATVNIVRQIILSGLFVLVEKRGDSRYLDFPHRKFREVLAVDYFLREFSSSAVIETLIGKKYSELALLFVEQSGAGNLIVNRLVDRIFCRQADGHHGELLVHVLARLSAREAEQAVRGLLGRLRSGEWVAVPDGVWQYLKRTTENCAYIAKGLADSLRCGDAAEVKMWIAAASRVGCSECESILLGHKFDGAQLQQMSFAIESRLIRPQACGDFLERFVELSSSSVPSEHLARQLYRAFVVGRADEERSKFLEWAKSSGANAESQYARLVSKAIEGIEEKEMEARMAKGAKASTIRSV